MSSEAADPVAWLRKQIEADLSAARIINAGGFSPQRWDTEPPGQVNPADIPQSDAITAAFGCPPEYICGWVQVVAYGKLNNEPDEAYGRDSEAPVALVDNGRREVDHIIRHDPRNVVADCEAKLAILDEHAHPSSQADTPCRTLRLLLAAYRHRSGYDEAWSAPAA